MTDYVFRGEDIKFCPGPCKSTNPEGNPVKINNADRFVFKPYSGGRYSYFTWPMTNGDNVTVTNIRVCAGCNARYLEEVAPNESDGDIVFKKLKDFTPEIAPCGPEDDL